MQQSLKKYNMKSIIILLGISISLSSCAYMAREVVAKNSCKRCEVINSSGDVVWSEDDCGGGVHNMELRAKGEAYDMGCGHTVNCTSYKQDPPQ